MSSLSPIKARELIKILKKIGFMERRQKGNHLFLSHEDGRTTVVPIHPSKSIGTGLLRSILHDVKLSPEEFEKFK
ncbi:type II toxin-antitoxin system HicA family toxin [Candidatus Daviesbacteria bacterium]|nr:type II toxin-antitoxin system HicA family toxin [Candidatus Daviesbacteria bacterium]